MCQDLNILQYKYVFLSYFYHTLFVRISFLYGFHILVCIKYLMRICSGILLYKVLDTNIFEYMFAAKSFLHSGQANKFWVK